jgi:hypothetical protein
MGEASAIASSIDVGETARREYSQLEKIMTPANSAREFTMANDTVDTVLELPGLYGPFTFPEKLLQKIWLRREFDESRAFTTDGRRVTVVHGGKWNLMGGPDFKNARVRFGDGPVVTGDIELHLHAADWSAHRHSRDVAYDGVILHVVLFPPSTSHVTLGAGDISVPVFVLLPLLFHDLEEYAADDAVEVLANRPAAQIVERLGSLPLEKLTSLLTGLAESRWRQKVRFARMRIDRLDWEEACHQTVLEILGYRFNRAPMLRVGASIPIRAWAQSTLDLDAAFEVGRAWALQGLRPANHPRVRLRQYASWSRARPEWTQQLIAAGSKIPDISETNATTDFRRIHKISGLRRMWNQEITDGAVGGTRFDNLVCDGFLPLLAARGICEAQQLWFHWFTGDIPPLWNQALRQLEVFSQRVRPACHGAAQGLLGWLIEHERSATVSAGRSA